MSINANYILCVFEPSGLSASGPKIVKAHAYQLLPGELPWAKKDEFSPSGDEVGDASSSFASFI